MCHFWNNMRVKRSLSGLVLVGCLLSAGCTGNLRIDQKSLVREGLAVGFVANHGEMPALKPYQRARYADKLASAILESNPRLQGNLDSYRYFAARMGKPTADIINGYRLEGELSPRALKQLQIGQLRRRYLMLATISPVNEAIELPVGVTPVVGPANADVDDYEELRFQTVRLKAVRVQLYDTRKGVKVQDRIYRSDDQDIMLASERSGTRYLGNSLLGALANSVSNRVRRSSDVKHPPAPGSELTLDYLWRQIARSLPGAISP